MTKPDDQTPGNPMHIGLLAIALLFGSVYLNQSHEPGGMLYLGRFLFVVALVLVGWAVVLWYRQAQEPQQERDPEV